MQGPQSSCIEYMVKQFRLIPNLRYCVSTYKDKYNKRIEDEHIVYSAPMILLNNKIIDNIKKYKGEEIYCQQIYSTFVGLNHLKTNYSIGSTDIVIKCRTDEYFNVEKFLNLLDKDYILYNIDYVYDIASMSDHLFSFNFDVVYATFYDLLLILVTGYGDTEKALDPLFSIETVLFKYLNKYFPNIEKSLISLKQIFPCRFVRNNIRTTTTIDENDKLLENDKKEYVNSIYK